MRSCEGGLQRRDRAIGRSAHALCQVGKLPTLPLALPKRPTYFWIIGPSDFDRSGDPMRCAVHALTLAFLTAPPLLAQGPTPEVAGPEGQQAFDDLGRYYQNREQVPPFR